MSDEQNSSKATNIENSDYASQSQQSRSSFPDNTNPLSFSSDVVDKLTLLRMYSPTRAISTTNHSTNFFANLVMNQLNDIKNYVSGCDVFLSNQAFNLDYVNAKPLMKQAQNVATEAMHLYNSLLSLSFSGVHDDSGICADLCTSFSTYADASFNNSRSTAPKNKSLDYSINAILDNNVNLKPPNNSDSKPIDQRPSSKPAVDPTLTNHIPPSSSNDNKLASAGGDSKRRAKAERPPQPIRCEFCAKDFHVRWRYETHRRTHTGERPFVCSIGNCRKAFADCSNLRAHIKTHGEKLNVCPRCGKSFTLRSYYNKHRKSACERNQRRMTLRALIDDRRRRQQELRMEAAEKVQSVATLTSVSTQQVTPTSSLAVGGGPSSIIPPPRPSLIRIPMPIWYQTPLNVSDRLAACRMTSGTRPPVAVGRTPLSDVDSTLLSNPDSGRSSMTASTSNQFLQCLVDTFQLSQQSGSGTSSGLPVSTSSSIVASSTTTTTPSVMNSGSAIMQLFFKYLSQQQNQ